MLGTLLLSACDREERHSRSKPLGETVPAGESPDTIWPGGTAQPPLDPRATLYDNNAPAISQGQTLFTQMNCSGCHSHGGGGMGPPLMDDEWRYGGSMPAIAATILDGRPGGMPAFRARITEDQAWQLAAFVRALSAQPRQDALPARADEPANTEPMTLDERKPMRRVTPTNDL
ncbi:MAG TPA: c-type cytochrome, partial [Phenylobacterium sp.]